MLNFFSKNQNAFEDIFQGKFEKFNYDIKRMVYLGKQNQQNKLSLQQILVFP